MSGFIVNGATGPTGPAGDTGPQGDAGSPGVQGPQGSVGAQGTAGAQGNQGATGPAPSGTGVVYVNSGTPSAIANGSTGQVLTVSGGAPVWQASSPTLLWEADFTTNQTWQIWVGGLTYAVVGSNGTGNLNFKHAATSTPNTVEMVNGSGLENIYPASSTGPCSSITCALSQLSLSYFTGRPWRMWIYHTYSGTMSSGNDNQQFFFDLDGTGATSPFAVPTYNFNVGRVFAGATPPNPPTPLISFAGGFGTNYDSSPAPAPATFFSSDVFVLTCIAGQVSACYGSWSAGWPDITSIRTFNAGSIQQSVIVPSAPYIANAGLCFRQAGSGGVLNSTNRKFIIKAMRFEGL